MVAHAKARIDCDPETPTILFLRLFVLHPSEPGVPGLGPIHKLLFVQVVLFLQTCLVLWHPVSQFLPGFACSFEATLIQFLLEVVGELAAEATVGVDCGFVSGDHVVVTILVALLDRHDIVFLKEVEKTTHEAVGFFPLLGMLAAFLDFFVFTDGSFASLFDLLFLEVLVILLFPAEFVSHFFLNK